MSGNVESYYIGSLISLLTNSHVRYEGFLSHLDSKHTTITLRNVKSFGTEGRRKDGSQVPPSEGIYEYIYFKGTDIMDLQVKSSPSGKTTLDVPDDPAIIQPYFSPPTSSPGASLMENISRNLQSAVNVPYLQGNHSLDSSIALSLGSSLPSLPLNNSTPTIPTYFTDSDHLPSLSQGLIGSHPSQQKTNPSLMNMHFDTNSPNVQRHHYLIPPISPDTQNGLQAPQKSLVFSSCRIPSMTPPSASGTQNGFPPVSPGPQNGHFPVPQMSAIGSPSGLPSHMNMHLATNSPNVLEPSHHLIPPISPGAQNGVYMLQKSPIFSSYGIPLITPPSATSSQNRFPQISSSGQNGYLPVPQLSTIGSPSGFPSVPPSSVNSSQNGFPPVPLSSATYSLIPHKRTCSQDSFQPVGLFPAISSLDRLPSPPSSSVTGSRDSFQPLPPLSTTYSLIPPISPGSQSFLLPAHLPSVTGSSDALRSLPPSPAAGNGFSPATPLSAAHSDAGLFSMPALNIAPTLLSNLTFSDPNTPADLKSQVASSSSTSPHVNAVTTSVKEVATSVPGPVVPFSSMLISENPTAETRSNFGNQNHIQPSGPLLQQEKIQLPSSHSSRILSDYAPVQVSASVALTSGLKNVKEPPQQIVKPQANNKDRDVLQNLHSDQGFGKGRAKLPNGYITHAKARGREPNGYRTHAKARGREKDRDALQGGRNDRGYAKGRENLPNGAVVHTQYGYKAKARGHEASHSNKNLGGDHRSNSSFLSTGRLGRAYTSGGSKVLHPVNKFTEDFNFEAMYEKFNKEKVWGLLGKSTVARSKHKYQDGVETKIYDSPVAVDHGLVKVDDKAGRGRVKRSERKRIDRDTFGEVQKLSEGRTNSEKHQRGRGIQGPLRAGGSQGSFRGRGYDHPGRGQERTVWSRVT